MKSYSSYKNSQQLLSSHQPYYTITTSSLLNLLKNTFTKIVFPTSFKCNPSHINLDLNNFPSSPKKSGLTSIKHSPNLSFNLLLMCTIFSHTSFLIRSLGKRHKINRHILIYTLHYIKTIVQTITDVLH